MKLQISETKAAAVASKLGEKRPRLVEDIVRILSALAEIGLDPFTRRDVTAVLTAMGWDCAPEHAWKDIGSAIESRCDKTGERGYYTQGAKAHAFISLPEPEASPSADGATETPSVSVVKRAGLAWVPELILTPPDVEGFYSNDVGLRRMAVADSSCYGIAYSAKASACQACPLARFCSKASMAAMTDIAALLDAETEATIVAAHKKAAAPATVIPDTVIPEPVPAPIAPPFTVEDHNQNVEGDIKSALNARFGATGWSEIALPFEGVCGHCDKTLPKDFMATHIPGKGVLHPVCALKL